MIKYKIAGLKHSQLTNGILQDNYKKNNYGTVEGIAICAGLDRLLGLQEFEDPRIFIQFAHEFGKIVSRTNRPPQLL